MTSQGSAQGRFQRAIHARNLFMAELAAREMGHMSLANALALTLLIAETEPRRFERAAVRCHVRFVEEARGISLPELQLALAALPALVGPEAEAAAATLAHLARSLGVNEIEALLRTARLLRRNEGRVTSLTKNWVLSPCIQSGP